MLAVSMSQAVYRGRERYIEIRWLSACLYVSCQHVSHGEVQGMIKRAAYLASLYNSIREAEGLAFFFLAACLIHGRAVARACPDPSRRLLSQYLYFCTSLLHCTAKQSKLRTLLSSSVRWMTYCGLKLLLYEAFSYGSPPE